MTGLRLPPQAYRFIYEFTLMVISALVTKRLISLFYIGIIVVIILCSIHRLVHAEGIVPKSIDTFFGADSSESVAR